MAWFIWFHQHLVCVCKLVSANYCFQVKSSHKDRVITSTLGKISDVTFSIAVSEPSFSSICFADTFHDSTFPLPFVILVLINEILVERFDKSVQKPVCITADMRGWMNILGDFNKLWHHFEINYLAGSVRFTEYLKVIFELVASKHPYFHFSFKVRRYIDYKT